ncbi:MAG TPA: hypothetical protein VLH08_03815 [Acidobacteriota bacterium]|nr:hypothetical protein [Acidobacteriota bacterium]
MRRKAKFFLLIFLFLSSRLWSEDAGSSLSNILQPFSSYQEAEQALRTAKIVDAKDLGTGVTFPVKLYLEQGDLKFKAVFKTVNERRNGITKLQQGPEVDFKDSWMFEVAAYELDKLLNLHMVPPTVERIYRGKKGSVQLWVENAMTERDRKSKKLEPPDVDQWNRQISQVRLFDNLIYNIDRNLGNLLITGDWKIYMIDHSRCFKSLNFLRAPTDLKFFAKPTMEALEKLTEAQLKTQCSHYLNGMEIRTLLKRRDMIVQQYQTMLSEKGDSIYFPWN